MGIGNHNEDVEGYLQSRQGGRFKFDPFPLNPPFKAGDYVRLRSGHAPQQVIEVKAAPRGMAGCGYVMRCGYTRWFDAADSVSKRWRTCDDYTPYEGDPFAHDYDNKLPGSQSPEAGTKKETDVTKLYQTNEETPRFGTLLARNSTGQLVLEMKDGGPTNIQAFDPEAVEEVKPYTIAVMSSTGNLLQFESTKGLLNEGDVVITHDGLLGVVQKVNTGFPHRATAFKGRRIVTEPVGE